MNGKLVVESPRGVGVAWTGAAMVDGKLWPVASKNTLWLADGAHAIEASKTEPPLRLTDLNADLKAATSFSNGLEFVYQSSARALAILDRAAGRVGDRRRGCGCARWCAAEAAARSAYCHRHARPKYTKRAMKSAASK